MFLSSELTDDAIAVYSDNIAPVCWLQEEIESMLHPPFADASIPVVEAYFVREGDARSFITERAMVNEVDLAFT